MPAYASNTHVPADRSRAELERLLHAHGADQFAYASSLDGWVIGFRLNGRTVRMGLPRPTDTDPLIQFTPAGRARTPAAIADEVAKEDRRRWRSLLLVVKAKLTAVADGISSIEREFMADLVLPNGRTVVEHVWPQIEAGGVPELTA